MGKSKNIPEKFRQCGRPYGGRAVFRQQRIDALPEVGLASDVANALGIKRASVQQWWERKVNPLPFANQNGLRLFRRDVVIAWLIATRRYKPKPEYHT